MPEHKEQFVSYAKLEKLDKLGRKTIFEGIPRHSYYIKDLLDGYIEHQKNTVKSKEYNNDLYSYWLSIEEDNRGIYMKDSTTNMFRDQDKKIRDGVEAGKYFWQYFIQALYR